MKLLATLNPSKACGPDEIPNCLLKEYAELFAFPVSKIINSSFKEQRLPKILKIRYERVGTHRSIETRDYEKLTATNF